MNDVQLGHMVRDLAQQANKSGVGHAVLQVVGLDGNKYKIIIVPPNGPEAMTLGLIK